MSRAAMLDFGRHLGYEAKIRVAQGLILKSMPQRGYWCQRGVTPKFEILSYMHQPVDKGCKSLMPGSDNQYSTILLLYEGSKSCVMRKKKIDFNSLNRDPDRRNLSLTGERKRPNQRRARL